MMHTSIKDEQSEKDIFKQLTNRSGKSIMFCANAIKQLFSMMLLFQLDINEFKADKYKQIQTLFAMNPTLSN